MIEEEESKQDLHQRQKIFIDLSNTYQGQALKAMNEKREETCWSDSQEFDKDTFNANNKYIHELEKHHEIAKTQEYLNNNKQYQLNLEFKSTQNFHSPKISQASPNMIYSNEETLDYMKQSLCLNRDKSNCSRSPSIFPKNMCLEKEFQRQHTIKSFIKPIRTFNSLNEEGFNYLESKNRAFYERVKQKLIEFYNNNTLNGRTKQLNKNIRKQINDLSDYIPNQMHFNIFRMIENFTCLRIGKIEVPILNPQSYFGFIIKIIITIITCLFLFFFSLSIVFSIHNYQVIKIIRIVWGIEIILKFNTAQFKNSLIIVNRREIIMDYFKAQAYFDIFPIILLSIANNQEKFTFNLVIQSLIFIKIYNIMSDLTYIQSQLCMMVKNYYLVQLCNLVFKLFLIGHTIACFWYILAQCEKYYLDVQNTWLEDSSIDISDWWKLYLNSLYWALTLMTTGSNTAYTSLETFYTTIIMLFTTITFGYFLNAIGIILSEFDEKDENRRRDINIINEYMRQKNISKQFII